MWATAENAIASTLKRLGLKYELAPGDGAFYGPKVDFKVLDSLKREWQLATIQVDFGLAEKFDLNYIDSDGQQKRPVVLHRAILGSFERMFGILIEHYGGAFPLWLSPEQVRVVPVSEERHEVACRNVLDRLKAAGLRASVDLRSTKMGAKVREATMSKVNYILVIGDREAETNSVSVRRRDGQNVGTMTVHSVIAALQREAQTRAIQPVLAPPLSPAPSSPEAAAPTASAASKGGVMRAVRLTGVGEAKLLRDVPIPEPGPGQVRIKVVAAGICGTDKHLCAGDATVIEKAKPPRTLGHEFCGEIDTLGADVRGLAPGDYVTAEMHVVCGSCYPCRTGAGHVCENTVICGLHADGSFADYVVVPASNVLKLDRDAVPPKIGAFLDALGNAVHTASATNVPGRNIVVLGYGPIGAMTAAVVEFMGASQVFITEVHPFNLAQAQAWAAKANAKHPRGLERVVVLDVGNKEKRAAAVELIKQRTNGGADAALEISGHPDAINDGLAMSAEPVRQQLPRPADHPALVEAARGARRVRLRHGVGALHLRHAGRAQGTGGRAQQLPRHRGHDPLLVVLRRERRPVRDAPRRAGRVISDSLNHASIIDGIRLCKAQRCATTTTTWPSWSSAFATRPVPLPADRHRRRVLDGRRHRQPGRHLRPGREIRRDGDGRRLARRGLRRRHRPRREKIPRGVGTAANDDRFVGWPHRLFPLSRLGHPPRARRSRSFRRSRGILSRPLRADRARRSLANRASPKAPCAGA
jgi:threonine dehydrogenase-like Zn-dependent dehydrogenase